MGWTPIGKDTSPESSVTTQSYLGYATEAAKKEAQSPQKTTSGRGRGEGEEEENGRGPFLEATRDLFNGRIERGGGH